MDTKQGTITRLEGQTESLQELVAAIPQVAAALRKEGLSEGRIHAALLALCGVQVDSGVVNTLLSLTRPIAHCG